MPHAAHVRYYADIVHEKYVQRTLISTCTEVLRKLLRLEPQTADEILHEAEQKIFSILEQQEHDAKLSIARHPAGDASRGSATACRTPGNVSGLATTFGDIDHLTTGFQPAELIILAARPSMGKTALICNWAEGIARSGNGVLLFSLEQSKLELAERFLCMAAQIDGHKLRSGDIDDEQRQKLLDASHELSEIAHLHRRPSCPQHVPDRGHRPAAEAAATGRPHHHRLSAAHRAGRSPRPREQQIAQITRRLKQLSKELNVPVIALAQLNRGVELREEKRPRLADLRESGAIEQDADLVMFLHRPDSLRSRRSAGRGGVDHRQAPQRSDRDRHAHLAERIHAVREL